MERNITRICVFDFDGTLMNTMTPEIGKPLWKKSTGFEWSHRGWWASEESLDVEVFGCSPIDKVIDDYNRETGNEETLMVMMTGRIPKIGNQVKKMLSHCNLIFDDYIFNDGGPTLEFKINKLNDFLKFYPALETMGIWEDRPEHTKAFQLWAEEVEELGIDCTVNQV